MADMTPAEIEALLARAPEGYTPGPWKEFIDDSGGRWSGWPLSVEAIKETDKTVVRTGGQWPYEWDAKTSEREACANAALIALAPELVAAVRAQAATIAELRQSEKAAWDMIEGWNDMEQERDEARNASKHYAAECERHLATIADLTQERDAARARSYALAVAIMGGEDAPGLADGTETEALVDLAREENRRHMQALDREARLTRERDAAMDALVDADVVLSLVEHPAHPDPWYHAEVKALGQRIGFGALMTTASAGWREVAEASGDSMSGVFVAGPCIGTVQGTLRRIRAALAATGAASEGERT